MIYIPALSDCAYRCLRGVIMISHTPSSGEKTRAGASWIDYDVFSTLMMIIIYVLLYCSVRFLLDRRSFRGMI